MADLTAEPAEYISATQRKLIAFLEAAPIPTTPIVQLRHVEERGLALLDLSSRLDHVARQSETLSLIDRDTLHRNVSMDVDLSVLAERHFHALAPPISGIAEAQWARAQRMGSATTSRNDSGQIGTSSINEVGERIWIPITNQTRTDLAQILVRDASDQVLPRMASPDVLSSYAAGLVKLFRMQLEAFPNVPAPQGTIGADLTDPIGRIRNVAHRARWLLESCIHAIAVDGFPTTESISFGNEDQEADDVRKDAIRALNAMSKTQGRSVQSFLELLEFTASNYPVLILVPRSTTPIFVHFEGAPLSIENSFNERLSSRQRLMQAASPTRVFTAEYESLVARGTSSYHVTLVVDKQLRVRRYTASTNSDARFVETLADDMRGVARMYDELRVAGAKLLENELQSVAARIAKLTIRRVKEAENYRFYLKRLGVNHSQQTPTSTRQPATIVADLAVDSGKPVRDFYAFAQAYASGALTQLVDILTPEILLAAATRIEREHLGNDLLVDNDPREHGAHIYWHRQMLSRESFEPVRVRVTAELVDDPPSLDRSVGRMLLALSAVLWSVFTIALENALWFLPWRSVAGASNLQADALVTVLLLIPGLLLTRLDIPETNSVLGQVRLQSRVIAYTSFGVLASCAIAVAASPRVTATVPRLALLMLLLLIALNSVAAVCTGRHRLNTSLGSRWAPNWVKHEFDQNRASSNMARPVTFVATQIG